MTRPILKSLLSLCLLALPVVHAQAPPSLPQSGIGTSHVDRARELLQKWAETQQLIANERRDWEQGRAIFKDRIALVNKQIEDTRKKIGEAKKKKSEAEVNLAKMQAERDDIKDASASLGSASAELEKGVREVLAKAPPGQQEKLAVLLKQLNDSKENQLSSRYQAIIGMIDVLNQANNQISTATEVRQLPDGRSIEVDVIYLGLGQGYYVSQSGDAAGTGILGPEGWQWTPQPDLARPLRKVGEILAKKGVPEIIPLPATVK